MRRRSAGVVVLALGLAGCFGTETPPTEAPKQPFRGMKVVAGILGDKGILPGLESQRGEWAASSGADLTFREVDADSAQVRRRPRLPRRADGRARRPGRPSRASRRRHPPVPTTGRGREHEGRRHARACARPVRLQGDRPGLSRCGDEVWRQALWPAARAARARARLSPRRLRPAREPGRGQGRRDQTRTAEDVGRARRAWRSSSTAATGTATASPTRVSPWPGGPTRRAWATRPSSPAPTSLGQHRDQYSFLFPSDRMEPRLTSPPFVEALQKLVGLTKFGPAGRREIRRRRRAERLPIGQGRPADRPGRAGVRLGARGRPSV